MPFSNISKFETLNFKPNQDIDMADLAEGSEVWNNIIGLIFHIGNPHLGRCRAVHGGGLRQYLTEEGLRREEGAPVDQPNMRVSYEKAGREIPAVQVHG